MAAAKCRWGLKILIKLRKFYMCKYDSNWYFCVVNVSSEHSDVNMKFLHPKGHAGKLFWPKCDYVCWILVENVYCEADVPSTCNNA